MFDYLNKMFAVEEPVKLRGHHLIGLADHRESGHLSRAKPEYGWRFNQNARKIFKYIIANPDAKVQIIDTPDSLCKYCKAPGKDETCMLSYNDRNLAELAGLEAGKTYDAGEVLQGFDNERFSDYMFYRGMEIMKEMGEELKSRLKVKGVK